MTKKRPRKAHRKRAAPRTTTAADDRRENLVLREVVNELVDHVRWISQHLHELSAERLDYAQERLEWLADEVWRLTVERE